MFGKSFKGKIISPVISILFVSFLVLIIVVSVRFSNYNDEIVTNQMLVITEGIKKELDQERKNTYIAAINTSKDS